MDEAVNEFLDGDGCHLIDFLVDSVRSNCAADIEIHLKSLCTAHTIPTSTTSTDSTNADMRLVERHMSRAAMYIAKTDAFKRLKLDVVARSRKLARLRCDVLENDYLEHSFAGNSTFGLDLAQSTRFPGDSDTTRLVEQLEDPGTSTQQRVALLNSLLSLATSAIGKKKHLPQILRICKQTIMEENTLASTLVLLKKLFNTKDSDIVSEVLCSLISNMSSVLHSALDERSKLKAVMLLFKMMCVCPALWPRFQPQSVFKMISSLIQYIGSVDINDMSISNLVAILAALDPRANWMRSWVHALSSRQIMKASLPSFACKAKNFLRNRPEWDSSKYQSVFLHYSPKELLILMHTSLCSVLFIWMKYDDLYAIFGNDEWTQILESIVNREFDRNNKSSSNKTIAKLLYEVAYCRTPAEFLLSISAVRILSRIRSVCGIRIIRIALTVSPPSDLSVPLICAEISRHISNHSRAKRYEALLCLCLLASRIGWANLGSYIHCDFIECNGDEEINRVVREIRAVREIYLGESLADYLKCESACNFAIPSHFVEVTSADQKLVVSKIMDLCMREGDAGESFVNASAHLQLSAQLAALVWQPRTGVDLLKCFDCSLLLHNVINKSYESGDSSALVMLRVFTLNLDVAIELRSQAKMLRRLFQAVVRWNSKDIGATFDSVSIKTFALFASIMIGGPSEVVVNQSLTSSIIKNPRSIIKLMYIESESCGSSEEQMPIRSLNEVIEIMEKDRSYSAVEVLTFLASTVSVGNGILITRRLSTSDSADQSETNDYPLIQECTALLDYAIYLKLITTRKQGRRLLPQLRIPYVKHRKECDWFFNVVFLMLRMDVHLTNFVCSRLIHHENAAFFWPTANMRFAHYVESYAYAIVVEMLNTSRMKGIKRIFEREFISLYHLFLLLSNQIYLNVLDWPNVCRYVVLSIAEGPGFQARHFCAVLLHIEEHLRHYSSRGNLLPLIMNFKQLSSFNFTKYASIVDDLYKEAYAQHNDDQH